METNQHQQVERQVILLDLSLFILDLLSPQKIKENVLIDNLILEVPGALVSMLWSARADIEPNSYEGKSILFDFIYAHLLGIKNNPLNQNSQDQMIQDVVIADQPKLHLLASIAYERLFSTFADLIEGATREKNHKFEAENRNFPNYLIRRYEPSVALDVAEEYKLQESYRRNFGLRAHPLYDLYFMQIYHAQTIGLAASPILKRDLFALGNKTFQSIQEWKKDFYTKWAKPQDTAVNSERIKEIAKKVLKESVRDELIGLTLSAFIPGAGVVLIASKIIPPILDITQEVTGKPITDTAIIVSVIALVIFCIGSLIVLSYKYIQFPDRSSYSPTDVLPTQSLYTLTPVILSTTSPIPISPTSTITPTPNFQVISSATWSANPNYCLYVVQRDDSLQSVAAWFSVTENDINASDNLVNWGAFTYHQMIRVPNYCCTHVGINNGYSYFVQPGDNVFRLALNHSTSVEKIVAANNLDDSRYIQSGQMLCMPYP